MRLPSLPSLRRVVARWPWLRRVAGNAVDRVVVAFAVPPPGLRSGPADANGPAGSGDLRPVLLILLLGVGQADESIAGWLEHLAGLVQRAPVRPVLVIDGAQFALVRRAGFAVDHVLAERDFAERYPDRPFEEYLEARLGQLRRLYGSTAVWRGSATDAPPGDEVLLGVLPATPSGWVGVLNRFGVAVLRRLDPPVTP